MENCMEVVIDRDAFVKGLQMVQNIVEPRQTLPILANVLLEADGEAVRVTATDLEVGARVAIPAKVASKGAITVSARKLGEIVKELPAAAVALRVPDNVSVSLRCAGATYKLVGHSKGDRGSREFLDDLTELPGRDRDGPLRRDLRGDRDARSDLEVGRSHPHRLAVGLEKYVRQNRKRLARLDDVLHHLQAFHERVPVDYDFHAVLHRCLGKNDNIVAVEARRPCGSGESAGSGTRCGDFCARPPGISVWRSRGEAWITE